MKYSVKDFVKFCAQSKNKKAKIYCISNDCLFDSELQQIHAGLSHKNAPSELALYLRTVNIESTPKLIDILSSQKNITSLEFKIKWSQGFNQKFIEFLQVINRDAELSLHIDNIEVEGIENILDKLSETHTYFPDNLNLYLSTHSYRQKPYDFVRKIEKIVKRANCPSFLRIIFFEIGFTNDQMAELAKELASTGLKSLKINGGGRGFVIEMTRPNLVCNTANTSHKYQPHLFSHDRQASSADGKTENNTTFKCF